MCKTNKDVEGIIAELESNARSRSAKLRSIIKIKD